MAEIIRRIFKMYADGISPLDIAKLSQTVSKVCRRRKMVLDLNRGWDFSVSALIHAMSLL
ncbi:hypothetical protein ACQZ4O_05335 [Agrobacterium vitis]|uniref:hypothetical protein n=1 Tax=Rhizobium/Agrobacterium group TaxID=227290 RepID=UPI0018D1F7E4|nr:MULTISPECIES: hypothetical protein [Rhizobium/Agrobacterium group]